MLLCAALLAEGLVGSAATARSGPAASPKAPPVARRLRPLQMDFRMRAHIRGVSTKTFRQAMLLQRLGRNRELSRYESRIPVPRAGVGRAGGAAGRARAPRPPARPLLRTGVGYPLPPWLQGIKLPDVHIRFSRQVYRYLAYYRTSAAGRRVLSSLLGRMARWKALISAALRRHGLPQDLIYIAMIESSFNPRTVSRAGATGLWQFMPSGGKIYGLKRNFWVDERYNPERSTWAAMFYLKDLRARFGNWELALAAYNAGYNGLRRAIAKYNTNDYWRLCEYEAGLPYETTRYVPKFFAIAVVANNLERFGIKPRSPRAAWEYALVDVKGGTPLSRIAQRAGVKVADLRRLNPELRRNRVPPGQTYELRLPQTALVTYRQRTARSSTGSGKLRVHVVRYGDSLDSIAADYGVGVALLRRINQIHHQREVRPGVKLVVPDTGRAPRRKPRNEPRTLVVVTPLDPLPAGQRMVYYRVVEGDRLAGVAKALGVKVAELVTWNAVNPRAPLFRGMVLRAAVPAGRALSGVRLMDPAALRVVTVDTAQFHEALLAPDKRRRIVYRARAGDTMRRVARRFGISVGLLARYNGIARGTKLRPGRRLIVYTRGRARRRKRVTRRRRRRSKPARAGKRSKAPNRKKGR